MVHINCMYNCTIICLQPILVNARLDSSSVCLGTVLTRYVYCVFEFAFIDLVPILYTECEGNIVY